MTKGEIRAARKAAKAAGKPLTGELRIGDEPRDDQGDSTVFSETAKGYRARERWARRYYESEGRGDY